MSKNPIMQVLRMWIVIICVSGTIYSEETQELLPDLNAILEINSDAPEIEMATSHSSGTDSGEKVLDQLITGKMTKHFCFYLPAFHNDIFNNLTHLGLISKFVSSCVFLYLV